MVPVAVMSFSRITSGAVAVAIAVVMAKKMWWCGGAGETSREGTLSLRDGFRNQRFTGGLGVQLNSLQRSSTCVTHDPGLASSNAPGDSFSILLYSARSSEETKSICRP
jgi:hypothetical protein